MASVKTKVVDKDKGWAKLKKRLAKVEKLEVVVGITATRGSEPVGDGLSLVGLATIHEFGAPSVGIPQRSFLAATFDENVQKYDRLLQGGVSAVVKKSDSPKKKLFIVGETARRHVIERIAGGIAPPLAAQTISQKGSDLPLVDTGVLRNSIESVVRGETK